MHLHPDICYNALISRDSRFDGQFFVGVLSTGIYCRPVCRARKPNKENTRFYASAAAAEQQGFRPCLLCRPELAPGVSAVDSQRRLTLAAANLIEQGFLRDQSLQELATRLNVSDRYLRKVFQQEYGVSPSQYVQTHRLLLAKQLLTETNLGMTQVAFASGFSSTRRFNAAFKEHYRMQPNKLKRQAIDGSRDSTFSELDIKLELPYRPPYDWNSLLIFLESRCLEGIDQVIDNKYCRIIRVPHGDTDLLGWFEAKHNERNQRLQIRVSASVSSEIGYVINRLRSFFDLSSSPTEISTTLGSIAEDSPGLRVPGSMDGFEIAVRAIMGQQVTVKAARIITNRFVKQFGTPLKTPFDALYHAFPSAKECAELSTADIASLGVIRSRANAIIAIAQAITDGKLHLTPAAIPEQEIEALLNIKGIGPWTANYIAMRALSWPDADLAGDIGVRNALALQGKSIQKNTKISEKEAREISEEWRPWRSYAAMHLWNKLQ